MSKTQDKRASYPYKREYFAHMPGYLGRFFFCGQCGCLLERGTDEIEVDHIIPLASVFGPNHWLNCVSTCKPCNRAKSSKGGVYIVRGFIMKAFELIYLLFYGIIRLSILVFYKLISKVARK